jgi:hypothetical protein
MPPVSQRLTVFVSSTVRDFGPVRKDLAEWLASRQIEVRESEDPEFPVQPGVHSQEACLRAIEGSHVYVLLVGWRYGGLYQGTPQSITWREYDEARKLGVPVLAFVLGDVTDEAIRQAETGRPLGKLDPGIVRFVDAIRKAPRDNWVHLEWDGSFGYLRRCIESRMNALFVSYQRPHRKLEAEARRLEPYAKARAELDGLALEAVAASPGARRGLVERVLQGVVEYRDVLFGFDDERYNFVIHQRDGGELRVFARRHHPAIQVHNRSWPLGVGHVGRAGEDPSALLVSPNVEHEPGWHAEYATDLLNYRSAVCVPILGPSPGQPSGVLTVTSSRIEHFRSPEQLEVLTARSLARIISLTGVLDRWPSQGHR